MWKDALILLDATTTDVVNEIAKYFAKLRSDLDCREHTLLGNAQEIGLSHGTRLRGVLSQLDEIVELTEVFRVVLDKEEDGSMEDTIAKCVVMGQALRLQSAIPPPPAKLSMVFRGYAVEMYESNGITLSTTS